jgi:tripartite-type tricarboxylate transporter receptor subunit TctC
MIFMRRKKMSRKKSLLVMLVISIALGLAQRAECAPNKESTAGGQQSVKQTVKFPTKPIEFIVPFAPGGNVDLSARMIAKGMEEVLQGKIVVVNKAGGGATVGQQYAANAAADGHTMIALTSSFVTNIILKDVQYSVDSLEPIGMFTFDPEIMLVHSGSELKTIEQLLEKAKKEPLMFSTPGHSTSHHIAGIILENISGAKFEYIHTNGSAEQTVQIAGGHVEIGLSTYGGAASLIDQRKIRVLAVAADERLKILPDVPTFKEIGFDYNYGAWRGIAVPKGTPKQIKDILEDAFMKTMTSKSVVEGFSNSGFPITLKNAQGFGKYIIDDYKNIEKMKAMLKN